MATKTILSVLSASVGNPLQYTCPADTGPADDLILLFQSDPAQQGLEVVKLSSAGLPPKTSTGKNITWQANFGIKKKNKNEYVDVAYGVIVTPRTGYQYVYYDGSTVRTATLVAAPPQYPGKMAINLAIGDPGVGISSS
jgi:hypothetical protein